MRLLLLFAAFGAAPVEAYTTQMTAAVKAKMKTGMKWMGGIFGPEVAEITAPICDCQWCIVEARRPAEIDGDVEKKCAKPPDNDNLKIQKAPFSCAMPNNPILCKTWNMEVSTERFCFYQCKPSSTEGPADKLRQKQAVDANLRGGALMDTQCVALTDAEIPRAMTSECNGRDSALEPSPVLR